MAGRLYPRDERPALRRFLLAVILAGALSWVGYWLLPGVGPVTAFPGLFSGPLAERQAALTAALAQSAPMTQPPTFPRDCAPSLHTAWALLALLAAWPQGRRFFLLILPLGVMSIVTTLTLCKHYAADLVIAVPFALLCWCLAGLLTPRSPEPALRRRLSIFLLAEAGALGAIWWWASWAPISPWLAWPLVGLCIALPLRTALRLTTNLTSRAVAITARRRKCAAASWIEAATRRVKRRTGSREAAKNAGMESHAEAQRPRRRSQEKDFNTFLLGVSAPLREHDILPFAADFGFRVRLTPMLRWYYYMHHADYNIT